jgi:hypothetical protein
MALHGKPVAIYASDDPHNTYETEWRVHTPRALTTLSRIVKLEGNEHTIPNPDYYFENNQKSITPA